MLQIYDELFMREQEVRKTYPNIVGIFLYGSQNYHLNTEYSDIDSRTLICPTIDDIANNHQTISKKEVIDVRLIIDLFKKQNLTSLELLFTKYKIVFKPYEDIWEYLIINAEDIAHYHPYRAAQTVLGMAKRKYASFSVELPSSATNLKQYGYNPKELYHLLRLQEYFNKYKQNYPFQECFISNQISFLKDVKLGKLSYEEALKLNEQAIKDIIKQVDEFCILNPVNKINKNIDNLLTEVKKELITASLKIELYNKRGK